MQTPVIVRLVFRCPQGHEIVYRYAQAPHANASQELNQRAFTLHCTTCYWTGSLEGSQKQTIELVEEF